MTTPTVVKPEQAVSDLQAAVSAAASNGRIEEEDEADELSELVDDLAEHLPRTVLRTTTST